MIMSNHNFNPDELLIEAWPQKEKRGMQTGSMPVGIKVTHLKTGIIVKEDSARHQHLNRDIALDRLWNLLNKQGE